MALNNQAKLEIYETMLLIRASDLKMIELYKKGEIEGHMLPCAGQEAIPAALAQVYTDDDILITGHRGGGHYMARGCDYYAMWAELFGKSTGIDKGRGGQIHLMQASKKAITGNAIVGAQYGLATGAGFVARKDKVMCVCVGGEGSTNRGTFHESLNMAAVQNLPMLYVIEYNNRQMWNVCTETTALEHVWQRAAGYGMKGAMVDGNDPEAVYEKAMEFATEIKAGSKPCLLECVTYKWTDSVGNVRNTPEAVEEYKKPEIDAIARWEAKLRAEALIDDESVVQIKLRVEQKLQAALDFARKSPAPQSTDGIDEVYSQPV